MVVTAAALVLSDIESAKVMFAIEKQLETMEYVHDDATAKMMILSEIDCAYKILATERRIEMAGHLGKQHINTISYAHPQGWLVPSRD